MSLPQSQCHLCHWSPCPSLTVACADGNTVRDQNSSLVGEEAGDGLVFSFPFPPLLQGTSGHGTLPALSATAKSMCGSALFWAVFLQITRHPQIQPSPWTQPRQMLKSLLLSQCDLIDNIPDTSNPEVTQKQGIFMLVFPHKKEVLLLDSFSPQLPWYKLLKLENQ